jgi:hypothetical protein
VSNWKIEIRLGESSMLSPLLAFSYNFSPPTYNKAVIIVRNWQGTVQKQEPFSEYNFSPLLAFLHYQTQNCFHQNPTTNKSPVIKFCDTELL